MGHGQWNYDTKNSESLASWWGFPLLYLHWVRVLKLSEMEELIEKKSPPPPPKYLHFNINPYTSTY